MSNKTVETDYPGLVGLFLEEIEHRYDRNGESVLLTFVNRERERVTYVMRHPQECCESVYVDKLGMSELQDLTFGGAIVRAWKVEQEKTDLDQDVFDMNDVHVWSFFHFKTERATAVVAWHGAHNGYYSANVEMVRTIK